jgi:hypothetical protein
MSEDPLVAELRAATASLVTATAAAEVHDWAAVELGATDAKHRLAGMMKDIAIKLLAADPSENVIPATEDKRGN